MAKDEDLVEQDGTQRMDDGTHTHATHTHQRSRARAAAVALAAALALAAGCGDNLAAPVDASTERPDAAVSAVQRGRYIANTLGACTFCHTPLRPDGSRDVQRLLAGVDCLVDIDATPGNGFGCISTANLTNHPTGLMNKSDEAIKAAIRDGARPAGGNLAPLMPYWVFHNMTDADLDALVAYLRTVPGIDRTVPPNEAPWIAFNTGDAPAATPIDPDTIPLPGAGVDQEAAMRGRYLSSMAGLCIDCHTPDLLDGNNMPALLPRPIDMTKPWGGGRVFPKEVLGLLDPAYPALITTRNLTSDATGLQSWSIEQIAAAIADGRDRDGNAVCAGTHGSLISPYAALTDGDLRDIATYIKSLPALANSTGADCAGPLVP